MLKRIFLIVLFLFASLLTACNASNATPDVASTVLTHYQVVNPKGETIARVEDLLIAADSGQISYALVILQRDPFSYGIAAFYDAVVPRTAVPWEYLSLDSEASQLHFKADEAVLYTAPLLEEKPNHLESDWDADIRAYWQTYPVSNVQK